MIKICLFNLHIVKKTHPNLYTDLKGKNTDYEINDIGQY